MGNNVLKLCLEEKKFFTGEININYVVGPNNGPALVLIPAQTVTWKNYKEVFKLLTNNFQVFAVDIRGHGKSDWTPNNYSFDTIGKDMTIFIREVVKKPAFVSGNSSGGLIALWLAANTPEYIEGIVLEDPPLFSAEWPRIKDEHVYGVLQGLVEIIDAMRISGDTKKLSQALQKIERPIEGSHKTKKLPKWLTHIIASIVMSHKAENNKGRNSYWYLPQKLKLLVEILTTFDSDFSKAWIDGRIYKGLNHEEALGRVKCPSLLLHVNWFRHEKYGLVGAMDDNDIEKVLSLMPHCIYKRINSSHVIHSAKPKIFVQEVIEFTNNILLDKETIR